ncbi:MAG TPA: HEAT repeat domain-containing protein, partial [Spirochaetia bacterium]|nr:HEAT repeat domain-containing protein [Spirochaetia bacterium]
MKTKPFRLVWFFLALLCVSFPLGAQVVDSGLAKELQGIFPELAKGFIDLNGNGAMDQLEDMDEKVPESVVKDNVLQAQEILDFIVANYRFIRLEKLLSVKDVLSRASGAIPEIIALTYSRSLDTVIQQKRDLGANGIVLTPSALREGLDKMRALINTMLVAFKKEDKGSEAEFVKARDELFMMIETGYPLPELQPADRSLLESALINTIAKDAKTKPERVRSSIQALGKLKSEASVPYLMTLIDQKEYGGDVVKALGAIGNSSAFEILKSRLQSTERGKEQNAIIEAIGMVGGVESLTLLFSLFPKDKSESLPPETEKALIRSISEIAAQGNNDRRIPALLNEYLKSEDPEMRILAVRGLAGTQGAGASQNLLPLLKSDKSDDVKVELVRALSVPSSAQAAIPVFTAMLKDQTTSTRVKSEIIRSLANSPDGARAIPNFVEYLGSSEEELRKATALTLLKLYGLDPKTVSASLSRTLLTSKDEVLLVEGTRILSQIADQDTVNTLITLLSSPYPEVKKHATWALYRIRPAGNAKVIDELKKLVTGETESLEVRINAVRGLGAIGSLTPNSTPQTAVWPTILTALKMRDEKYTMLRFYAVRALGDVHVADDEIIDTLVRTVSREQDTEIKREAVESLRKLSVSDERAEKALSDLLKGD